MVMYMVYKHVRHYRSSLSSFVRRSCSCLMRTFIIPGAPIFAGADAVFARRGIRRMSHCQEPAARPCRHDPRCGAVPTLQTCQARRAPSSKRREPCRWRDLGAVTDAGVGAMAADRRRVQALGLSPGCASAKTAPGGTLTSVRHVSVSLHNAMQVLMLPALKRLPMRRVTDLEVMPLLDYSGWVTR